MIRNALSGLLLSAFAVAVTACGGGDPEDDRRADVTPPCVTPGACK